MSSTSKSSDVMALLENNNIGPSQPFHTSSIQNFLVVWLDGNIDEVNNDDHRYTITKLRKVVNKVITFTNADECIDFITNINPEKVFMISSGTLGQTTVPIVHDIEQVNSIYIFCGNKARHEEWAQHWSKVKGVFTDIKSICVALNKGVQECDQNNISMSFIATSGDVTNKNLDQLDRSFMYTQILKEILLTIDFKPQHMMKFITYCRGQFVGNTTALENITKLEQEYSNHSPIWWYTYRYFLSSMLNRALGTIEVDLIIKLGFFIRHLHEHITSVHLEQYVGHPSSASFTVYRGQGLSQTNFDQLVKTKGGLISFNNFLLTNLNRTVSLAFAESSEHNPDLIGVLFQITIDSSISSTPFANLLGISYYPKTQEILFSIHSIFRIGQIQQIDTNNRLWQVDLMLTSDNDPQLHTLTEYIRQETFTHKIGWDRLGELLIKLGEFDKAQQVYEFMLDDASKESEKAEIYYHLGCTKDGQEEYLDAIKFYEKSIEIDKANPSLDRNDFAGTYNNMGKTYEKMGEYEKAFSFHKKVLDSYQDTLPPNHPDLVTSYDNMGNLLNIMDEYSKALSYYEKAFEIRQKTLPSNHPDLAISYDNMGEMLNKMGECQKAMSSHEQALEIKQKIVPLNHPSLATSYKNIGLVYQNMGNYLEALSSYEKALEIRQKTLPPNHPDIATSYAYHVSVYEKMGEYSKAISSQEKELEIQLKTLPPNHPHLALSYNNIGFMYDKIGDHSKALSFYLRAVDIGRRSLPTNHPKLEIYQKNVEIERKKL